MLMKILLKIQIYLRHQIQTGQAEEGNGKNAKELGRCSI